MTSFTLQHSQRKGWSVLIFLTICLTWALSGRAQLAQEQTLYDANFGGNAFVSVGDNGTIYSSIDGGSWDLRDSGTTNRLESIAHGGGLFVAAGENGVLVSSPDGINWTSRSIVAEITSPDIAYGNGTFVVAGVGAPGQWTMLVSTNGADWAMTTTEGPALFGGITFGGTEFVTVGGEQISNLLLISTDGLTWKERGILGIKGQLKGPIVYEDGHFSMLVQSYITDDDDDSYYLDRLMLSEDGVSWSSKAASFQRWSWFGAGDCTHILPTTNPANLSILHAGTSFTNVMLTNALDINTIAYGNGLFVAVGNDITILDIPQAEPSIPIVPAALDLQQGNYAFFTAGTACLDPPVFYQWTFNDIPIENATTNVLQLFNVETNNAGRYSVIVTNLAGQIATGIDATLTVTVPDPPDPPESHAPVFFGPTNTVFSSFGLGTTIVLTPQVSAWPPASFQWRFNGVDIPGATEPILEVINTTPDDVGLYTIVASNELGIATSVPWMVNLPTFPPEFHRYDYSVIAIEGGKVQFSQVRTVTVGAPPAQLRLFKDGVDQNMPLHDWQGFTLTDVSLSDAGLYALVASNSAGSTIAWTARVEVTPGEPLDRWTQKSPLPQGRPLLDVTFGEAGFLAVGEAGAIVSSADGINWSKQRLKGEVDLRSVAFGNDPYVAVSYNKILTSVDGINWVTTYTRADQIFSSVTYGNDKFVVPAGLNNTLTSTDGINWISEANSDYPRYWLQHVAHGNGRFVASDQFTGDLYTSTDGGTWTRNETGSFGTIENIRFVNARFIAVGDDGLLLTSLNGIDWIVRDAGSSYRFLDVTFGNGRYLIVGTRGRMRSSTDAINWRKETSGTPDRLETVAFGAGLFVALGENGTTLSSPDGVTWTKRSQGSTSDLDAMVLGDGIIVIAGKDGTIMTSTNGCDFVEQSTGVENELHGIGWGGGLYVAVGEPEIILTSPNAVQWTVRHEEGFSSLKGVARGPGGWVAVGTEGTILTSPDGITWSRALSPTCNDLNGVAYGHGLFVVVGDNLTPNGTLITSPDGVTWTRRYQYIGKNLRSITFDNNMFLATANDGRMILSTNGLTWNLRFTGLGANNANNLRAATFAAGHWVVAGNYGLIVTSTDGLRWTIRPRLTEENLHGMVYFNGQFVTIANRGVVMQSDPLWLPPTLSGQFVPGGFELLLNGDVGVTYEVQKSAAIDADPWSTLGSFRLQQTTTNILDATATGTGPHRFYRAVAGPTHSPGAGQSGRDFSP